MNLRKKKKLAARTLGVGVDRIIFTKNEEIKEAITRQDIRDMVQSRIILIKAAKGRKHTKRKRKKIGVGKRKKIAINKKQIYVKLTRKLREYAKQLVLQGKIDMEKYKKIRKQIRARDFKSKSHFKELLLGGK